MTMHYVEDHPDRKVEDTVPATPVDEPKSTTAKVVESPTKAPAEKSSAKVTTKKG